MKNILAVLVVLATSAFQVQAEECQDKLVLTPKAEAILKFSLAQRESTRLTDGRLLDAKTELEKLGFSKESGTDAILIAGGCGYAGCESTFLVTTSYATTGANTETRVIAGVVVVSKEGQVMRSNIKRVLSEIEIAELLKD